MTPCNGCGGTDTYESEADGYTVTVCRCGIVRSVAPGEVRSALRSALDAVREVATDTLVFELARRLEGAP